MSQITIDLTPKLEERMGVWQKKTSEDAALLATEILEGSLEDWEDHRHAVELALDEADIRAAESPHRLTHEEVFTELRKRITDEHDL